MRLYVNEIALARLIRDLKTEYISRIHGVSLLIDAEEFHDDHQWFTVSIGKSDLKYLQSKVVPQKTVEEYYS